MDLNRKGNFTLDSLLCCIQEISHVECVAVIECMFPQTDVLRELFVYGRILYVEINKYTKRIRCYDISQRELSMADRSIANDLLPQPTPI